MKRFKAINPDSATGKTRKLLTGVEKTMGTVPNMMRTMANSQAVLEVYLRWLSPFGRWAPAVANGE